MVSSPAAIKELRERTGAGMMDCKKALDEAKGDMEQAIDWLRKKGLAAAAKKAARVAAEGLVAVAASGTKAVAIELNSETDFVARNEQFQTLVETIAAKALEAKTLEATLEAAYPTTGRSVKEEIVQHVASIGENMNLRRVAAMEVANGVVATYVHSAVKPGLGKIGILLALESTGNTQKLNELGRQLAMHIAAAKPESLDVGSLSQELIEREKKIFSDQASASGKPANIIEKMIEGRIRKYYEEVVLLEQVYVIDGKTKISDVIKQAEKEVGAPIAVKGFTRFQLGEGIEKEEADFAEEVRKAAGAA